MCNKISFHCASDARKYIKTITARRTKHSPKKLRVYFCGRCNNFHLTSQKKLKIYKRQRSARRKKNDE